MSKYLGGWFDPSPLVDLMFWLLIFVLFTGFLYYKKYMDKRHGDQKRPKEHIVVSFIKLLLAICLVWIPVFVCASLYLDSSQHYWETTVSDTDYVGNLTNTTITKIGVEPRYEIEHQFLLPFPDYEEDIVVWISDTSLNGNGTMTAYIEALDLLGNVQYNKSCEKVLTDLDGNIDSLKFGPFESEKTNFRLVQFLNGTTDTDLFSLTRSTSVVTFAS